MMNINATMATASNFQIFVTELLIVKVEKTKLIVPQQHLHLSFQMFQVIL